MQSAECKMQNEGSGTVGGGVLDAPRVRGSGIVGDGFPVPQVRASEPVGAVIGRPQTAEATPFCHSERSEESASPVPKAFPLRGRCPSAHTGVDEVVLRQAIASDEPPRTTVSTSSVSGLAGDARCHLPLEGNAGENAGGRPMTAPTDGGGRPMTAPTDGSGRPQTAEATPFCHSEQSEESASPVSTAPQTMTLIARSQAGDKAATERLLEENVGLIRAVARRYWGRGVEQEDLIQLGSLGFLKAVAGFDPAFGTQFSTYAVPKIAGEIRRFLRDDGAVKVSRTLKERALAIHLARDKLSKSLGREPVLSELAEALNLTVEEIAEAETASDPVASIQQPAGDSSLTLESVLTDSPMEEQVVERLALRQALDRLPERDARVVALRYFHGLTQDRTAKLIGVSQVQVSRIEKKALARLRELLE